jgi:hypothetical protein
VWGLMDGRSSSHAMDRDIKETHSRVGIVLFFQCELLFLQDSKNF